jgi:hypothetical protein
MTYKHEAMSRRKFLGMIGAAGITLAGYPLAVKKASADSVVRIEELVPDRNQPRGQPGRKCCCS